MSTSPRERVTKGERTRVEGKRAESIDLERGEWSLVESFECDGHRYVVARECTNRPPVPALTPREHEVIRRAALGHHNKLIAHDLGIAHATVRVLLSRAAAKFGVRSRSDAIASFVACRGVGCDDP